MKKTSVIYKQIPLNPWVIYSQYKYTLVLTDVQSKYVTDLELLTPSVIRVLSIKSFSTAHIFVCLGIFRLIAERFSRMNLRKSVWRDSEFRRDFILPIIRRAAGIVERNNATIKQIISKLVTDHPSAWNKLSRFAMCSLRTSVNETLGISPYQAVFGRLAIGPLQLL
jgi:hypothetical protein